MKRLGDEEPAHTAESRRRSHTRLRMPAPREAEFAAEVAAHVKADATDVKVTVSVDVDQTRCAACARVTYVDADGKTIARELPPPLSSAGFSPLTRRVRSSQAFL
jgi:hypothetical protein